MEMNGYQKRILKEFISNNIKLIRNKKYTQIYNLLQEIDDNNGRTTDRWITQCFTEMMFKIGENPFEGIKEIDYSAGIDLSITELTIPNSVKVIGDEAFMNCTKLKTVKMSDSVTEICDKAFQNCYNLKNITISENLEGFGVKVFDGCLNLENIYYNGTIEKWKYIKNSNAYSLGTHSGYYRSISNYILHCIDGDYYWKIKQEHRGWEPVK